MVRTYQRKSTYSKYNKEHILQAVKAVKVDSKSLTKVADEYGIKVSSLYYHLNRYKYYDFTTEKDIKAIKNFNQVFTKELEYEFMKKFVDATDYCFGLGPMNIRKFAYEFAMQKELDLRQTWMEKEVAGEDWLNAFMKRHPTISSISGYNTHSIQLFYKTYEELLDRFGFQDSKIFKVDEIAFTTAERSNRVFARRGKKVESELQFVGQDELTTMVSTVSADGSALKPMFIIPRTGFVSDMIEKAMEGSIKVSNKSGWMTKSDFLEYLAHFVKVTQCKKTDPCLMILDNHASSLSLEAITYAKENGVYMLILPLHTYNKLQPLKENVFVNLRIKVNNGCRKWVATNSEKPMKIKDIVKIVERLLPKVFTSADIKLGFETSNVYPLNSNYSDENTENLPFLKVEVTMNDEDDNSTDNKDNDVKIDSKDDVKIESKDDHNNGVNDQNTTDPLAIDNNPVEKQELETPDEVVVIYSPKNKPSVKLPLSQIEQILGISLPSDKKDSDVESTEQKENVDEHRTNEADQKDDSDVKIKEEKENIGEHRTNDDEQMNDIEKEGDVKSTEQKENIDEHRMNETEQVNDSKRVNRDEDIIVDKVNKVSIRNKSNRSDKIESEKRKRRKPNSKLSDYICY